MICSYYFRVCAHHIHGIVENFIYSLFMIDICECSVHISSLYQNAYFCDLVNNADRLERLGLAFVVLSFLEFLYSFFFIFAVCVSVSVDFSMLSKSSYSDYQKMGDCSVVGKVRVVL